MRWMTLAHLHLDRVATAWLIARFIDDHAEFEFLTWDQALPEEQDGLTLFGVPGARFAPHDEHGTCFAKVLRAHELEDPGLQVLAEAVDAGVRHALGLEPARDRDPDIAALGVALDLAGIGFGVTSDDREHLARASPLYDALLEVCRARTLPESVRERIPRLPGERSAFLRAVLAERTSTVESA
jgi:hypothetical protein